VAVLNLVVRVGVDLLDKEGEFVLQLFIEIRTFPLRARQLVDPEDKRERRGPGRRLDSSMEEPLAEVLRIPDPAVALEETGPLCCSDWRVIGQGADKMIELLENAGMGCPRRLCERELGVLRESVALLEVDDERQKKPMQAVPERLELGG
jgi:hypothetical protein